MKVDQNYLRWAASQLVSAGVRTSKLFALCLLSFSVLGCSEEEPLPDPVKNNENPPVQYGTPFANVPATEDVVMYEVNVRAFSPAGNLKGVEARLDEIKKLGVNVVWLMPIYPIGEERGVGSPYAVKDYKKVNPDFGSLEDLRSLVQKAHEKDMAVMLDWVANHTSWDHPWIQNPTWYAHDASGNIISPPGMGWTDVAELNYGSQTMRKEMIEAMKYWVLEANIDGYRCDYAEGVPTDFWKQAIDALRDIPNRELVMFAEGGKKELLTAGFDMIFGWNFYSKLKEVFNENTPATGLISVNAADYTNIPAGTQMLRWIDNHDVNAWEETPLTAFKGQKGALAAFVITSYMGGVPLIYNGQEVGFPMQLGFFENTNTKIDWSVNPEILAEYQKLMAFRGTSEAVRGGSIETYNATDVMAFKRKSGSEEVVVMVNVRNRNTDFQLPATLTNTTWKNALSGENVTLSNSIALAPFSYLILKKP